MMNDQTTQLPTAEEVADTLALALEEAEALLHRMQTPSVPAARQATPVTPTEAIVIVCIVAILWATLLPQMTNCK